MKYKASSAFSLLFVTSMLLVPSTQVLAQKASKTANIPPSADLTYAISAVQKGLSLNGNASLQWRADDGRYSIASETRASIVGKILESKSEGRIDSNGLVPQTSVEKRFRKEATTTTFDREANVIRFSASDQTYPIKGGEQDRNSVIWQLATIARSTPAKFKSGSTVSAFVAGQKNAEPWSFKVGKAENIKTGIGDMSAVKVSKVAGTDKDQKIDLWLAPSQNWYPVRIRFSEPDGDFIEQTISKITTP
ncbi:MAG: DUF3108 domain-containing protein [Oxalicibacterium faecigallinarum]|uniref:DUF3108 domain-containing protein n=1 Tax=Oxalicibacterium faecigallinarum TaxID=573741 RepID=UPI002809FB7C|nr:DUF3108 domain-containing protein [Oxalicibacterium faecigallinarum]MDQ7970161.1 DUF3108 domain-containing protein [Oxalicibacterium faecigallinarum]